MGLLPVETVFNADKRTELVATTFGPLHGPWERLSGLPLRGYEIRHGETSSTGPVAAVLPDGRGFAAGNILGVTVHGLFEQPELVQALIGSRPEITLEDTFDRLADTVEERLDIHALALLAGVA